MKQQFGCLESRRVTLSFITIVFFVLSSTTSGIGKFQRKLSPNEKLPPIPVNRATTWNAVSDQYSKHKDALLKSKTLHPAKGIDANSAKCTAHQLRYGQWIKGAHNCGLASVYKNDLHTGPFLDLLPRTNQPHLQYEPHTYSDWCWKPHNCQVEPFSIYEFCEKLQNRSILVVGDSLSHEYYVALASQLEVPINDIQRQMDIPHVHGKQGLICQQTHPGSLSRLGYLRNDHLVAANVPQYGYTLQPWNVTALPGQLLEKRDWRTAALLHFEILVLNKGAHQEIGWDEQAYFTEATAKFLRDFLLYNTEEVKKPSVNSNSTMRHLTNSGGRVHHVDKNNQSPHEHLLHKVKSYHRRVIFRTAGQGTPRSSTFHPVNETPIVENGSLPVLFPENTPNLTEQEQREYIKNFQWHRIPVANFLVEMTWRKILPPSPLFEVMYTEEMSSLRRDSHRCQVLNWNALPAEHRIDFQRAAPALQNSSSPLNPANLRPEDAPLYKTVKEFVAKGVLKESCDELHHYLPSDVDTQVFLLHNILR